MVCVLALNSCALCTSVDTVQESLRLSQAPNNWGRKESATRMSSTRTNSNYPNCIKSCISRGRGDGLWKRQGLPAKGTITGEAQGYYGSTTSRKPKTRLFWARARCNSTRAWPSYLQMSLSTGPSRLGTTGASTATYHRQFCC